MSLFNGNRDIKLFNKVTRELLGTIIDTTVAIYKLDIQKTDTNLYGEGMDKIYKTPVKVSALVELEEQAYSQGELAYDVNQKAKYSFHRDELEDIAEIYLEIGDIIEWDNGYWEIDSIAETQYVGGKNHSTDFGGNQFGASFSIVCQTHKTRTSKLNIERVRKSYQEKLRNI